MEKDPLEFIKKIFRLLKRYFKSQETPKDIRDKYSVEFDFWKDNFEKDNGKFRNDWYKDTFLALAEEENDNFVKGKIIADFGCGPRGSLAWADKAQIRIGIDVLADRYVEQFPYDLLKHNMIYLKSTETMIPLPSDFVDIMFTLNAIDHVDNFEIICNEILRVLKPGGEFLGSFNINEPASATEPQCLSEDRIEKCILKKLRVVSYRLCNQPAQGEGGPYRLFFEKKIEYDQGRPAFLWVRAVKPKEELM